MKSTIFKLIVITCISLLFSQCKKEEENIISESQMLGTVELGKSGMELVPYQLNDTLTFKDSLGNSQQFIVVNKRTQFKRYHKGGGGTDLTSDYYDIEALNVILKGYKDNYFTFDLTAPLPKDISNFHINKYYLYINMNLDISVPSSSYFSYIDTMDFYYNLEGEAIPFYSSITLLNNTYSSIYELADNSAAEKVFYSTSLGIVGFRTKDNELWYLDN